MWKTAAAAMLLATAVAVNAAGEDAKRVIDDASKAMGVVGLNSITFSGSAATGNFGQSRTISVRPRVDRHPQLHPDDRLHDARVARDGRHAAAGPARGAAASRAGDARRLRPVHHAGQWRLGAADADLDDAVGISEGRGGEQRDGEIAEDRRRAITRW